MKLVRLALSWCALILPLTGIAAEADPRVDLPCEPSRACAIEMARAAAYENDRRSEGNLGLMFGLLIIAEYQVESGDIAGFKAIAPEARRAIDGSMVQASGLDSLARLQARAGFFEEALATAGDSRTAFEREMAFRDVSGEFARRGRWREAYSTSTVAHDGDSRYAKYIVMKYLVQTGRRDWVMEALPALAPDREAEVLTEFERLGGNLRAAYEQAVRIADPEKRWMPLFEIAQAGIESKQWDQVVAVARFAAAEGEGATTPELRYHRIHFAIRWLSAAGRFDEALSLVPKYREEFHSQLRTEIAFEMVAAGELARARALLESLSPEDRAEVQGKIAIASVLAGVQRFEQALTTFPEPQERLAALLTWGEKLPQERSKEARAVLRAAMKLAAKAEDPDAELARVGELQAKRGFFADARATAASIEKGVGKYRVANLCVLLGAIIEAQAARGDLDGARKAYRKLERVLRGAEVDGYLHAHSTGDLARAGLLTEAFTQVQALSCRDHDDLWIYDNVLPVIRAHVEAGQLRRAFEIAALLSDHDYGRPAYFLEIARALGP